jgi:hypothetical protein
MRRQERGLRLNQAVNGEVAGDEFEAHVALPLFGGHVIDWNFGVSTEGTKSRAFRFSVVCPMMVYRFFVISAC